VLRLRVYSSGLSDLRLVLGLCAGSIRKEEGGERSNASNPRAGKETRLRTTIGRLQGTSEAPGRHRPEMWKSR